MAEKVEFLPRIQDGSVSLEERLVLLVQFVFMNGDYWPSELLPDKKLPRGYESRAKWVRDLVVILTISPEEAKRDPKNAIPELAQLWRIPLNETGIDPSGGAVVCTLNGVLTRVVQIDNAALCDEILREWAEEPPTQEELSSNAQVPHTLQ